ncbi:hypothetical protein Q5P01_017469 [Channa striata]|uniref:Interferon-induced protein 44-like n=1 Tax=Channa striata TaxID=64152 RepID=A0AA88M9J4_CHASR|nr:hypothetical protein Q5P01_017469 [Channa striata]
MGGSLFSQPWRAVPQSKESLDFVKSYQPKNKQVKHLRILLHGPVGAGKSSFISSVDSVLQGRVTCRALPDATSGGSFTTRYKTYKISNTDQETFYPFIFNDIMGFEPNAHSGVHVEDIKLALMGHVKEDYKFIPGNRLTKNDIGFNSSPTLDDKVHVLVSVLPANTASVLEDDVVKKMRDVRLAASDMGIPQITLLTKTNEACPKVKENIKNTYTSKYLKQKVDQLHVRLGIPKNCIFLVENYSVKNQMNDDMDAQILCALRQMIEFGEDYINHLHDGCTDETDS